MNSTGCSSSETSRKASATSSSCSAPPRMGTSDDPWTGSPRLLCLHADSSDESHTSVRVKADTLWQHTQTVFVQVRYLGAPPPVQTSPSRISSEQDCGDLVGGDAGEVDEEWNARVDH